MSDTKEEPTPFLWPGKHVTDDDDFRAAILEQHGPERIVPCSNCEKEYYSPSAGVKTNRCYVCWYDGEIKSYEDAYADVFDALRKIGLEPSIAQTGGMCMTIHCSLGDGYYLWLTNRDDTLSFERRLEDGWTLGVYAGWDEDGDGMPLPIFDGEDYLSVNYKSADFAVGLATLAREKLAEHLS